MSSVIGYMPMPAGFPYADVYKKGRPRHGLPDGVLPAAGVPPGAPLRRRPPPLAGEQAAEYIK